MRQLDAGYPKPVYLKDVSVNGTYVNGTLVGFGNTRILLKWDTISVLDAKREVYTFIDLLYPSVWETIPDVVAKKYFVETKPIGKGGQGSVLIVHDVFSCNKFAMKSVKKQLLLDSGDREAALMRQLNHPCIIKLSETLESHTHKYIVMELMTESLSQRMDRSDGFLEEDEVKVLFHQLALAVEHLHSLGIVHRDIKQKNIMLADKTKFARLKLIDFGFSKTDSNLRSYIGTMGLVEYSLPAC